MELESSAETPIFLYVDESGQDQEAWVKFNRAIVQIPGQRGAILTVCSYIKRRCCSIHPKQLGHRALVNILHSLISFTKYYCCQKRDGMLGLCNHMGQYYFPSHICSEGLVLGLSEHMYIEFLPPYSPFLNPVKFFSA